MREVRSMGIERLYLPDTRLNDALIDPNILLRTTKAVGWAGGGGNNIPVYGSAGIVRVGVQGGGGYLGHLFSLGV